MHLILKSSRARGNYCLREGDRGRNFHKIQKILDKFSKKYQVKIHRRANVGNHLHLHIELRDLKSYNPFIRAITAAIAMAVTGCSRWKKVEGKFWDLRPFTHLVATKLGYERVNRYLKINQYEPVFGRRKAEAMVPPLKQAYG
jgi:REP element-mobilizing transposase RayT